MSVSTSQFMVGVLFAAIMSALLCGEMAGVRLNDRRPSAAIGAVYVGAILLATVVLT